MEQSIINVKHLSKSYGSFKAVDDVSFEVQRGDVFGFLGPNGAGKSTTIRCMLSLIFPDQGSIEIFGKDLRTHRGEILSRIGSIIEKPDFYKYLSAQKNLEIFGRISGANVSRSKIEETLEFVGLKGREKDKVAGYSHGMRQRLGIAQTLLHDPDLIILDEPTTGLDPLGIIEIRNLIMQLKHERQKTIVLSSHILSEIELIANRMIIINKGKAMVQGEVAQLLDSQHTIVTIETDNAAMVQQILAQKFAHAHIQEVQSNAILCTMPKEDIPSLNAHLVQAGVAVFSLQAKRQLEDFFLQITAKN